MTLRQILEQRGIRFHIIRSSAHGEMVMICCPFCPARGEGSDTRFRLGVSVRDHWARCFNCNWRSKNATKQLLRALRLPPMVIEGDVADIYPEEPIDLPEGFHWLTTIQDSLDRKAQEYLLKRGVTLDQIGRNLIGVTFLGRYAYRVVFPIYERKQLNGFVSRALHAAMKPRYLNSSGEKSLYNFRPAHSLVLLEGIFKCLRVERTLRSLGADTRACALLGHSITDKQIEQIKKAKVEHVTLWPDMDRVGRKGMIEVARKIRELDIPLQITIPSGAADEVPFAQLRDTWLGRVPYSWSVENKLLSGGG